MNASLSTFTIVPTRFVLPAKVWRVPLAVPVPAREGVLFPVPVLGVPLPGPTRQYSVLLRVFSSPVSGWSAATVVESQCYKDETKNAHNSKDDSQRGRNDRHQHWSCG
jgi:hypothetical protein